MPEVLVVDRRLHQIQQEIQSESPVDSWPRVGAGGLRRLTVNSEQVADLRQRYAIVEDRNITLPMVVRGTPMDVIGEGIPEPVSRRTLRGSRREDGPAGEGVLVGQVDTGIQRNDWLDGGYLAAPDDFEDAVPQSPDAALKKAPPPRAEIGHGTFVAGLVLQQAPAAGVCVERALDNQGEAVLSRVVDAATQLAHRKVSILNLSLGCYATNDEEPHAREVMQRMVDDLHRINPGMVIVAAAGNLDERDGGFAEPGDFWPAAVDNVIAVGAVGAPASTSWAEWSNRGSWIDFAAPGTDLVSTYVNGYLEPPGGGDPKHYRGWAKWSGTSFAAAVVSGAIARLMNGPDQLSAEGAVARLRQGNSIDGWTDPEDGVPSVPVVGLRTADDGILKKPGGS